METKTSNRYDALVDTVRKNLTPDLLKPGFGNPDNPMEGHCYVASEALYHLLGGRESGLRPVRLRMPSGTVHWWLLSPEGEVLDPTHDQFDETVPYDQGRPGGFLTREPSARARALIERVTGKTKVGTIVEAIEPVGETRYHGGGYPFFYFPAEDILYVLAQAGYHLDLSRRMPEQARERLRDYLTDDFRTFDQETPLYIAGRISLGDDYTKEGEVEVYGPAWIRNVASKWEEKLQPIVDAAWGTKIPVTTVDKEFDWFEAKLTGYEQQREAVFTPESEYRAFVYLDGVLAHEDRPHPQILRKHFGLKPAEAVARGAVPGLVRLDPDGQGAVAFFSYSTTVNSDVGAQDEALEALEEEFSRRFDVVSYDAMWDEGRGVITEKTSKVITLPDVFEPHGNDLPGRRTFIYLKSTDTAYIAPNNAYHNDMWLWLHQNVKGYNTEDVALGFIERDYEDHSMVARMYWAEGDARLPQHVEEELSNYFGERVYQEDWKYPVDWRTVIDTPYDEDYDGEPTQQWPNDAVTAGTQPVELMLSEDRKWHFDQYLARYGRFAWVYQDGTLYCGDLHKDIIREMRREGFDPMTNSVFGWVDPFGRAGQPYEIATYYGRQDESLIPEVETFFQKHPPSAVRNYLRTGVLAKTAGLNWGYSYLYMPAYGFLIGEWEENHRKVLMKNGIRPQELEEGPFAAGVIMFDHDLGVANIEPVYSDYIESLKDGEQFDQDKGPREWGSVYQAGIDQAKEFLRIHYPRFDISVAGDDEEEYQHRPDFETTDPEMLAKVANTPKVMRVKTPRTKLRGVYGMPFTYFPQKDTIMLADSHTFHTRMWPKLPKEFYELVRTERPTLINGHIVPVQGDRLGGIQFYLEVGQNVDPQTSARIQDALAPYVEQLGFDEEEYIEPEKNDPNQLSLIAQWEDLTDDELDGMIRVPWAYEVQTGEIHVGEDGDHHDDIGVEYGSRHDADKWLIGIVEGTPHELRLMEFGFLHGEADLPQEARDEIMYRVVSEYGADAKMAAISKYGAAQITFVYVPPDGYGGRNRKDYYPAVYVPATDSLYVSEVDQVAHRALLRQMALEADGVPALQSLPKEYGYGYLSPGVNAYEQYDFGTLAPEELYQRALAELRNKRRTSSVQWEMSWLYIPDWGEGVDGFHVSLPYQGHTHLLAEMELKPQELKDMRFIAGQFLYDDDRQVWITRAGSDWIHMGTYELEQEAYNVSKEWGADFLNGDVYTEEEYDEKVRKGDITWRWEGRVATSLPSINFVEYPVTTTMERGHGRPWFYSDTNNTVYVGEENSMHIEMFKALDDDRQRWWMSDNSTVAGRVYADGTIEEFHIGDEEMEEVAHRALTEHFNSRTAYSVPEDFRYETTWIYWPNSNTITFDKGLSHSELATRYRHQNWPETQTEWYSSRQFLEEQNPTFGWLFMDNNKPVVVYASLGYDGVGEDYEEAKAALEHHYGPIEEREYEGWMNHVQMHGVLNYKDYTGKTAAQVKVIDVPKNTVDGWAFVYNSSNDTLYVANEMSDHRPMWEAAGEDAQFIQQAYGRNRITDAVIGYIAPDGKIHVYTDDGNYMSQIKPLLLKHFVERSGPVLRRSNRWGEMPAINSQWAWVNGENTNTLTVVRLDPRAEMIYAVGQSGHEVEIDLSEWQEYMNVGMLKAAGYFDQAPVVKFKDGEVVIGQVGGTHRRLLTRLWEQGYDINDVVAEGYAEDGEVIWLDTSAINREIMQLEHGGQLPPPLRTSDFSDSVRIPWAYNVKDGTVLVGVDGEHHADIGVDWKDRYNAKKWQIGLVYGPPDDLRFQHMDYGRTGFVVPTEMQYKILYQAQQRLRTEGSKEAKERVASASQDRLIELPQHNQEFAFIYDPENDIIVAAQGAAHSDLRRWWQQNIGTPTTNLIHAWVSDYKPGLISSFEHGMDTLTVYPHLRQRVDDLLNSTEAEHIGSDVLSTDTRYNTSGVMAQVPQESTPQTQGERGGNTLPPPSPSVRQVIALSQSERPVKGRWIELKDGSVIHDKYDEFDTHWRMALRHGVSFKDIVDIGLGPDSLWADHADFYKAVFKDEVDPHLTAASNYAIGADPHQGATPGATPGRRGKHLSANDGISDFSVRTIRADFEDEHLSPSLTDSSPTDEPLVRAYDTGPGASSYIWLEGKDGAIYVGDGFSWHTELAKAVLGPRARIHHFRNGGYYGFENGTWKCLDWEGEEAAFVGQQIFEWAGEPRPGTLPMPGIKGKTANEPPSGRWVYALDPDGALYLSDDTSGYAHSKLYDALKGQHDDLVRWYWGWIESGQVHPISDTFMTNRTEEQIADEIEEVMAQIQGGNYVRVGEGKRVATDSYWFHSWLWIPEKGGFIIDPDKNVNHRQLLKDYGIQPETLKNTPFLAGQLWMNRGELMGALEVYSDFFSSTERPEEWQDVEPGEMDYHGAFVQKAIGYLRDWFMREYPGWSLQSPWGDELIEEADEAQSGEPEGRLAAVRTEDTSDTSGEKERPVTSAEEGLGHWQQKQVGNVTVWWADTGYDDTHALAYAPEQNMLYIAFHGHHIDIFHQNRSMMNPSNYFFDVDINGRVQSDFGPDEMVHVPNATTLAFVQRVFDQIAQEEIAPRYSTEGFFGPNTYAWIYVRDEEHPDGHVYVSTTHSRIINSWARNKGIEFDQEMKELRDTPHVMGWYDETGVEVFSDLGGEYYGDLGAFPELNDEAVAAAEARFNKTAAWWDDKIPTEQWRAFAYVDGNLLWGINHRHILTYLKRQGYDYDKIDFGWFMRGMAEPAYAESYDHRNFMQTDDEYRQAMLDEAARAYSSGEQKFVDWIPASEHQTPERTSAFQPRVEMVETDSDGRMYDEDMPFVYLGRNNTLYVATNDCGHPRLMARLGIPMTRNDMFYYDDLLAGEINKTNGAVSMLYYGDDQDDLAQEMQRWIQAWFMDEGIKYTKTAAREWRYVDQDDLSGAEIFESRWAGFPFLIFEDNEVMISQPDDIHTQMLLRNNLTARDAKVMGLVWPDGNWTTYINRGLEEEEVEDLLDQYATDDLFDFGVESHMKEAAPDWLDKTRSISQDPFADRATKVVDGEEHPNPRGTFAYIDGELWFGDTIHPRILSYVMGLKGEDPGNYKQFIRDHEVAFGRFFYPGEFLHYMGGKKMVFEGEVPEAWFASGDYGGGKPEINAKAFQALQQVLPGVIETRD